MRTERHSSFRSILFLLTTVLIVTIGLSQEEKRDVVYLKNGSIIKGKIIEYIPDKSLRIQTSDGTVYFYLMEEVQKTAKERTPAPRSADPIRPAPDAQFTLYGGVAVPAGDFEGTGGESAGYAKPGFGFGFEADAFFQNSVLFSVSIFLAHNAADNSALLQTSGNSSQPSSITSFSTVAPMLGFGVYSDADPNTLIFAQLQAGILIGNTPEVSASSGSSTWHQASTSATSFAFGLRIGCVVYETYSLSAQFVSGEPKYSINVQSGGTAASHEYTQPTGVFLVCVGFAFH